MSRSTLLGGGGEQTSRLKNSQKVEEADMADVFEQGFTQLSSKDRSAVRPIMSYFLAWCWWWRASLERGNVIFLWFSTRIVSEKKCESVFLRQCCAGKDSFLSHSLFLQSFWCPEDFSDRSQGSWFFSRGFSPMQLWPIQPLPSTGSWRSNAACYTLVVGGQPILSLCASNSLDRILIFNFCFCASFFPRGCGQQYPATIPNGPPIDKTLMFSSTLCLLRPFIAYVGVGLGMFCDDIHTPSAHPPGGVSRTEHYIMLHKYPRTNSILPQKTQKTQKESPHCPLFIPHVHSF